jgi:hypothetical protein
MFQRSQLKKFFVSIILLPSWRVVFNCSNQGKPNRGRRLKKVNRINSNIICMILHYPIKLSPLTIIVTGKQMKGKVTRRTSAGTVQSCGGLLV